jgi:2'-5' RNA ligase
MELFPPQRDVREYRLSEFSNILYEYLLVISPDKELLTALIQMKNHFQLAYGCEYAASLIPHITLINFVQLEKNMEKVINYFERFSKHIKPFEIQLCGFDGFANHTVFVNVATKKPIVKIVEDMQTKFSGLLRPLTHSAPHFIFNPHITIARKMSENQYNKAMEEWHNKQFNAVFWASEIVLLKRKITGGKCETVTRFRFEGNGSFEEQGIMPF